MPDESSKTISVDVGFTKDTVLFLHGFNLTEQCDAIERAMATSRASLHVDGTGLGLPLVQELRARGAQVNSYNETRDARGRIQRLRGSLQVAIGQANAALELARAGPAEARLLDLRSTLQNALEADRTFGGPG